MLDPELPEELFPPPPHAAVAKTARTMTTMPIRRAFISELPGFVVVGDGPHLTALYRHSSTTWFSCQFITMPLAWQSPRSKAGPGEYGPTLCPRPNA